jgi:hypothetical protein
MSEPKTVKPIEANEFNGSLITLGKIQPIKDRATGVCKGGYSAFTSYNGSACFLKFPKQLVAPFGGALAEFDASTTKSSEPKITLPLNVDSDPDFLEKLKKCDEHILNLCYEQVLKDSTPFSLGSPSKDPTTLKILLGSKYKPMVKSNVDKKDPSIVHPPYINCSILYNASADTFETQFYDSKGAQFTCSGNKNNPNYILNKIPKGSRCSVLCTPSMHYTNLGTGITWKVKQVRVFPQEKLILDRCLLDEEYNEPEGSKANVADVSAQLSNTHLVSDPELTELVVETEDNNGKGEDPNMTSEEMFD